MHLVANSGAEPISLTCAGGNILRCCSIAVNWGVVDVAMGLGAESTSMGCVGGNISFCCSMSAIDQGEERRRSQGGLEMMYKFS